MSDTNLNDQHDPSVLTIEHIPAEMPYKKRFLPNLIGRFVFWLKGWKVVGKFPAEKKLVFLGAPHTSNWDFVYGMSAMMQLGLNASWFGKHTLFKGAFGRMLERWGGIPINRTNRHNVVDQLAEAFAKADKMYLGISPEGSRSRVEQWKTGFYHIAKAAKVPVLLIYFDYPRKRIGIGPLVQLTDNMEADIQRMREFYLDKIGRIPANA